MATKLEISRPISFEQLQYWQNAYREDPLRRVVGGAIVQNGIDAVAQRRERVAEMTFTFTYEIPTGPVTSQNQSGRCWLFAGLNLIRHHMASQLKLKNLELSQSFLMFYDKLEKANYFLDSVIQTRSEPLEGRLVAWLLQSPLQDGGQWDMFVNLVEKYGIVPKWTMPESYHSSNSRRMNSIITSKLREDAGVLRRSDAGIEDLMTLKAAMMADIYRMLVEFLGEPPERFDFEFQDDDGGYHGYPGLSPLDFWRQQGGMDLNDYVSIINAPTPDKAFGKTFTVDYLGNVVSGRPVLYLNLPIERFKELALEEVTNDHPVWFGCDVGPRSDRERGILDTEQYAYDTALGVRFSMSKADRLMLGESQMTHAMLLTGVSVAGDGRPSRWKVENSWGAKAGQDGFFVMSDAWFEEYMYQIVVPLSRLTSAERASLDHEPSHLPPWDPMGSLA